MASVDIVICHQHGHFLSDCVDSVLGQQVNDLRMLIIGNASTDSSPPAARGLAARDNRIEIVLRARNLGPYASFNGGVDWAKADYFMALCSDDLLAPGSGEFACDPSARTFGTTSAVRSHRHEADAF